MKKRATRNGARPAARLGRAGATLLFGALLLGAATAHADEVSLTDGGRLEGTVVFTDGDSVTLLVPLGSVEIPRKEIREIRLGPTREQRYVERARATDLDDPESVRALAAWCRREGLLERARRLEETARGIELEQRLREAEPQGADAVFGVALWARAHGAPASLVRRLLERVLQFDGEHAGAREALAAIEREAAERRRRKEEAAKRLAERKRAREELERVRRQLAELRRRVAEQARELAQARRDDDDTRPLIYGYAGAQPAPSTGGYARSVGLALYPCGHPASYGCNATHCAWGGYGYRHARVLYPRSYKAGLSVRSGVRLGLQPYSTAGRYTQFYDHRFYRHPRHPHR